jgi:hypothetical protein
VKRLAVLLTAAMGAVCAAYTVIYLVRWEWNRAIIAGLFFVAVEVVLASALILDRLRRLEARLADPAPARARATEPDPAALEAIRVAAPPLPDRFAWIREQHGTTQVFLPVLLGAGVLASALAWVVEHLARATATPLLEQRLAARLGVLRAPPDGLLGGPPQAPSPAPASRWSSWGRGAVVVSLLLAGGAGTAAGLDFLADRIQSRPDPARASSTVVHLELRGALASQDPAWVTDHLWTACTGPDVFRERRLPEPTVVHGDPGQVRILVDAHIGEHAGERLRGCLNDNTLDKVQARVVSFSNG